MNKILNILGTSPLFTGKTKNEIENILYNIEHKIHSFEKNKSIFRIDQATLYIGIILKGSIEVQKNFASGKVINLLYKKGGEVFGEGAVFSDTPTYPCSVISKEKSDILLISKENILKMLFKDSMLLYNFLSLLANRILILNIKAELLSYSSIQRKIAYSLLHQMTPYNQNNVIHLPYSKKSWAEHLNVSRPSLYRELNNLCNDKIIHVKNKTISILTQEKLENLLIE